MKLNAAGLLGKFQFAFRISVESSVTVSNDACNWCQAASGNKNEEGKKKGTETEINNDGRRDERQRWKSKGKERDGPGFF